MYIYVMMDNFGIKNIVMIVDMAIMNINYMHWTLQKKYKNKTI